MNGEIKERLEANESVFREINEAIERGQWPGEESSAVNFRCECAELGCARMLSLVIAEYEAVRAHPRRFIVAPGHERPEVEFVVAERPGYVVVEKRDQAGRRAEENDPRR